MKALLFLISIVILFIISYYFVSWVIHIQNTKEALILYGYANYKTFLKEFNKYEWTRMSSNCLRNNKHNCEICDDVIEINRVGMIMKTPIDYFLMKRFIKKQLLYKWK